MPEALVEEWDMAMDELLSGAEDPVANLDTWFSLRQFVLYEIVPLCNPISAIGNIALCLVTFPLSGACLFYVFTGSPKNLVAGGFGGSAFFYGAVVTLFYQSLVISSAVQLAREQDKHSQQLNIELIQSILKKQSNDAESVDPFEKAIVPINTYVKENRVFFTVLGLPLSPTLYTLLRGYILSALIAVITRLLTA